MDRTYSALRKVTVDTKKICSNCNKSKSVSDFYLCMGRLRGECKKCTIKKNTLHQKKTKVWLYRYSSSLERREYLRNYYAQNKEKFAQYRKEFRERYPGYHKEYYYQNKGK